MELEKIAQEQNQEESLAKVEVAVEDEESNTASKSRNKETLGRELSSNEESDQD